MNKAGTYGVEARPRESSQEHQPITLRSTFSDILSDISRYRITEKYPYPALPIICPSLIAVIYYRIGKWIWNYHGFLAWLVLLLRPFYLCGKRLVEIYTGISLSPRALIGRGLYINHFGSIFVGKVVMGDNCNLAHEVTLGVAGRGDKKGLPTLGDRVYIAPGAKIIGKIKIGNDVAVGANAVVTKPIPDCAVVGGIPARVISYQGSFDFVLYKSMHTDPKRLASLEYSAGLMSDRQKRDTAYYGSFVEEELIPEKMS